MNQASCLLRTGNKVEVMKQLCQRNVFRDTIASALSQNWNYSKQSDSALLPPPACQSANLIHHVSSRTMEQMFSSYKAHCKSQFGHTGSNNVLLTANPFYGLAKAFISALTLRHRGNKDQPQVSRVAEIWSTSARGEQKRHLKDASGERLIFLFNESI